MLFLQHREVCEKPDFIGVFRALASEMLSTFQDRLVMILLRCPKFFGRALPLPKFRPLPLARLAVSAPGSARLAPRFDTSPCFPKSLLHFLIIAYFFAKVNCFPAFFSNLMFFSMQARKYLSKPLQFAGFFDIMKREKSG